MQLGVPVMVVPLLTLISPFFLLMYGTMLSHTSGWVSVAALLWGYLRMRQTGQWGYGIIAGLAWGLLFLNRSFSAVMLAVPFALDALICLAHQRDRKELIRAAVFGGCALTGVCGYLIYNGLLTGDPLTPTYLHYDATQTLGFGLRHLYGLPVDHSLGRGLANTWTNLVSLDAWLTGIRFSLPVFLLLGLAGWSKRWWMILFGAPLALIGGYVFFWFPGPRHIGPAYYFESMPFMLLAAGLGIKRISGWLRDRGWSCRIGIPATVVLGLACSRFVDQQRIYFNEALASQRVLAQTLATAPPHALVFLQDIEYPPFGKLTINVHGIRGNPLVMIYPGHDYYGDVLSFYPDRTAYLIRGGQEDRLQKILFVPAGGGVVHRREAIDMSYRTGNNAVVGYHPVRMADADRHAAGYLAFGFHRHLPPGNYLVHLHIQSAVGEGVEKSYLDVSTNRGKTILARQSLTAMATEGILSLPVHIALDDFTQIEPRVFFGGDGILSVHRIEIERIAG